MDSGSWTSSALFASQPLVAFQRTLGDAAHGSGQTQLVHIVARSRGPQTVGAGLPFSQGSVTKLLTGAAFLKSEPTTVALAVTAFDSYNVMLLRQ